MPYFIRRTRNVSIVSPMLSGFPGKDDDTTFNQLLDTLDDLKTEVGIAPAIKDSGLEKKMPRLRRSRNGELMYPCHRSI